MKHSSSIKLAMTMGGHHRQKYKPCRQLRINDNDKAVTGKGNRSFRLLVVLIEVNFRQIDGLMTGAICIQIQELPSCNPKVALTFVTVSLRYILVE